MDPPPTIPNTVISNVSLSNNVSTVSNNQLARNEKEHKCLWKCSYYGCQLYSKNRKKDDLGDTLLDSALGQCHGPQLSQVSSVAYSTSKIQSSVTPATFSPDVMLFSSSSDSSLFLPPSSASQATDPSLSITPPTPLFPSSQSVRQSLQPNSSTPLPGPTPITSASQATTPFAPRPPPSHSNLLHSSRIGRLRPAYRFFLSLWSG